MQLLYGLFSSSLLSRIGRDPKIISLELNFHCLYPRVLLGTKIGERALSYHGIIVALWFNGQEGLVHLWFDPSL